MNGTVLFENDVPVSCGEKNNVQKWEKISCIMYRDTRIFGNVDDTAGTLQASETDTDKKQTQTGKQDDSTQQETKKSDIQIKEKKIIRVGSFEDTFDYVDANGMRRDMLRAHAGSGWLYRMEN